MGGRGSGRRFQWGKDPTNEYQTLDVRRLHQDHLLAPGQFYRWSWKRGAETVASLQIRTAVDELTLIYRHRGGDTDWQRMEYAIGLTWTGCTFGGRRPWFLCPENGCRRRVARLYLSRTGIFTCRHCNQLVYACQSESASDRAARRADKIRERLGWEAGTLNGKGGKPKGMHRSTYERLVEEHDVLFNIIFAGWRVS